MEIRTISRKLPTDILENAPKGWEEAFAQSKEEIIFSEANVTNYNSVVPELTTIFEMYQRMSPSQIKICILTDEPDYETWNQMHGCGISGDKNEKPSGIMRQIHNRLFETVDDMMPPTHNSLHKWMEQGVFISSVCLTRGKDKMESHKPLWSEFTMHAIKHMIKVNPKIIFFFWGTEASDFKKYTTQQHTFTTGSFFSKIDKNAFCNMDHFNEANRILIATKRKPINWNT